MARSINSLRAIRIVHNTFTQIRETNAMSKILSAMILMSLSLGICQADDQVSSVEKGEVIFDEPLPHKGGKKGFAHGSTEVLKDGGITGRTDPKRDDGHAANYAIKLDHEDALYEFEIKLEGDSYGGIRVGYHMASCGIGVNGIWIGSNNTPDEKKTPVDLAKDKWHVVTVTRVGTHVSMRVGDAVVEGEEPKLKPTIDAIRLSVKGADGCVSYRKLKIWKAVKN
jgi:hypothetical protein